MDVTVGSALSGPCFAPGRTGLGRPIWNATSLLQDLELRLGLPPARDAERERLALWTSTIQATADIGAFYWRSFETDALGTARLLLEWRDVLVEAGWNGQPIGVARIDALAVLYAAASLPLGTSDRVARVECALDRQLYDRIRLLDSPDLWPGRWRRIFKLLAQNGTIVEREDIGDSFTHLPRVAPASDLEWLQARLGGDPRPAHIRGDGSLLLLRSDTPHDLAELTAALLASVRDSPTVVVRATDPAPLDAALAHYGLPSQGAIGRSPWRPAMQLLALALELAFEPRDPNRVLELLTLPVGPFRGLLGAKLARAVARQPGIGGKEWHRQKSDAAARLRAQAAGNAVAANAVELRLERVRTWLETPGAVGRIRRAELQAVIERVQGWLHQRLSTDDAELYAPAYAQAAALADLLRHDTRADFTREEVRTLFDVFARTEQEHILSVETTGRVAHVTSPAAVLAPTDNLFIWNFVGSVERVPRRAPWTKDERVAFEHHDIRIPDQDAILRANAGSWRRAALAARKRVVLIAPATIKGVVAAIHPFWDEIRARLDLDERGVDLVTRTARAMLTRPRPLVPVRRLPVLPLPQGRAAWHTPRDLMAASDANRRTSVTALERITTCPLAWVIENRAGLVSGAMSKVARGGLLNGNLAHRLVEILHEDRAFEQEEDAFLECVDARFEQLIKAEGATLLLAGASVERIQLARQLRNALRSLFRYLKTTGFRIAAVEEEISVDSAIGPLHGRIDLRLADPDGNPAILDLKWGRSTHLELLEKGRSIQLAAYTRAIGGDAPAGYFALSRGTVLTTDQRMRWPTVEGPPLTDTWERVEATAVAVLASLAQGIVHVPAARLETPLLDLLAVPASERDRHYEAPPNAACEYCEYDGVCGRKWRSLK